MLSNECLKEEGHVKVGVAVGEPDSIFQQERAVNSKESTVVLSGLTERKTSQKLA